MSRWTVILLIIITNIITLVLYNISLKNSCQKAKLDVIQTAKLYEEDLTLVEQHHHQEPNLAGDKKTSLFTERKQNIEKICENFNDDFQPYIFNPEHLVVLQDRKVTWCPVFKAGSSTWMNIILDLSTIPEVSTLKPRYNEPQYSEFRDIVNKTQLPFLRFTKHITFDIDNYSV